jgi:NDP-sugar pyrophosphorylase family protein
MQIIIPMSGLGKRFVDSGYKVPKPLLEVDGEPIIKHILELFPNEKNVSFICNDKHLKETNMREILKKICPDSKIYEVEVGKKRGPVEAVYSIIDNIKDDEEVIVSYCDYGTVWNYQEFLIQTRNQNADGAIACYTGFHPHMLGKDHYAYVKHLNKIAIEISEKEPFTDNKMSEYASNGTYYFKTGSLIKKYFKRLIDSKKTINNEFYVSMVYNLMIEDGLKVSLFEIEKMLQWGTPYDLEIYKQWSQYFKDTLKQEQKKFNSPENTTLLLPMAGNGSRFSKDGYIVPKPLIDVNGKPMVVQAVNDLPKTKNIIFGILQKHIDEYSVDKRLKEFFTNANIVTLEKTTQGQACTVEVMIRESNIDIEQPILISACDNGANYDQKRFNDLINDTSNDVVIWSFRNHQTSKNNPNAYAWLEVDEKDEIKHVSCKKFIYDDPLKTHAIIGTMFFRKAKYFLDGLKKNYEENITTNNEFYVDDVLNQNIKNGLKVKVFEVKNYICWGTPADYKVYNYWKEHFKKVYNA